jgi:hypothetical protein
LFRGGLRATIGGGRAAPRRARPEEEARVSESPRERRRYVRFQVPVKVTVKGRGLDETCLTQEVGLGGCRITLSRSLPEGTLLHVEVSSTRHAETLSGGAQVAWMERQAPWQCGLEFSPALVEAMGPFLRALVGEAALLTARGLAKR